MYVCMYVNVCMYACKTDITIYANWCSVRTGAMHDRIPLPMDVLVNGRFVKSIRINTCRLSVRKGRAEKLYHLRVYLHICVCCNKRCSSLTRAPLGGGAILSPPLVFLRYLLNQCRYHHQTCSTLSPNNFTHCVKILKSRVS